MRGRFAVAIIATMLATLGLSAQASAAPLQPFGHSCHAQNGVRFCPTTGRANRVATFDGIPLDADVTLPQTGAGRFPTIVMLHGWGGQQDRFRVDLAGRPLQQRLLRPAWIRGAQLPARGFGDSCGGASPPDHSGACAKGYIHLADTATRCVTPSTCWASSPTRGSRSRRRSASRECPTAVARAWSSRSCTTRSVCPTASSHRGGAQPGKPMSIAAAYPRWPWSDLVDALLPNGRFLDTQVAPQGQSLNPVGVPIKSYLGGLFALGSVSGYYCGTAPASTPCTDRDANIPDGLRRGPGGPAAFGRRPRLPPEQIRPQQRLQPGVPTGCLEAGAAADPERLDG